MKKHYSKPDIVFDDFSLSKGIAAGCEFITTLPEQFKCGVPYFNRVIFQNSSQGCANFVTSGTLNGYCYHNPTDTNNIFNS